MIARERLTPELVRELRPLVIANHQAAEVAAPLDPQWSMLAHLDAGDAMAVVVARVEGAAVGYVAHLANRDQISGEVSAVCLAIYLDPAHRGMARGLLRVAEDLARAAGAAAISYNLPRDSSALPFFALQGYHPLEVVASKRLG